MWIEISSDVFENSDFKAVNYIFQILSWYPNNSVPRYRVLINTNTANHTENFKKLRLIESGFDEYIDNEFNDFVVTSSSKPQTDYKITLEKGLNCFNIEESIQFFSQPVSIVLENNKNDSIFVISIIEHFDSNSELKEHIKNGWIKFEHAGGCSNLENFLEGFETIFQDLSQKNNRPTQDYFRGIVILDSDKEYPDQETQNIKLGNILEQKGYNVHILEKRMMENYLPDEVFRSLKEVYRSKQSDSSKIKWISSYLSLGNQQKDYLNIKGGFPKKYDKGVKLPIDNKIMALYADVSTTNFEILDEGFKLEDFKNKYPLLFSSNPHVHKESLQNRANSEEYHNIIDKISALI